MNHFALRTLQQKEEADDEIVNGFTFAMCEQAFLKRKIYAVPFSLALVEHIMSDKDFGRTADWVSKMNLTDSDVWLMPIRRNRHWRLIAVFPRMQLIIYFVSCCSDPNDEWIWRGLHFYTVFMNPNEQIDSWTVFVPKDIPRQLYNEEFQNDCGPMICTQMYIICTQNIGRI